MNTRMHDGALRLKGGKHFDFILHFLRKLKLVAIRKLYHHLLQIANELGVISFQNIARSFYAAIVILRILLAFARALAIAQVILEAYFKLACRNVLVGEREVACAHRVQLLDEVQHRMHSAAGRIWAKVFRAITNDLTSWKDARKIFLLNHNARVRFIVLEHDVITRLVLFDK